MTQQKNQCYRLKKPMLQIDKSPKLDVTVARLTVGDIIPVNRGPRAAPRQNNLMMFKRQD